MQDHEQYMRLALVQAQEALEHGDFPVGCVMVEDGRVVADARRRNTNKTVTEMDHCEILALRNLLEEKKYHSIENVTVYSTMEPCLMCYSTLLLNGIRKIVYAYEDVMGGGTNLQLEKLNPLYRDIAVQVVPNILRGEALLLFQCFFKNPDNPYWKDSLLCEYTLKQEV